MHCGSHMQDSGAQGQQGIPQARENTIHTYDDAHLVQAPTQQPQVPVTPPRPPHIAEAGASPISSASAPVPIGQPSSSPVDASGASSLPKPNSLSSTSTGSNRGRGQGPMQGRKGGNMPHGGPPHNGGLQGPPARGGPMMVHHLSEYADPLTSLHSFTLKCTSRAYVRLSLERCRPNPC